LSELGCPSLAADTYTINEEAEKNQTENTKAKQEQRADEKKHLFGLGTPKLVIVHAVPNEEHADYVEEHRETVIQHMPPELA
jgi:hypothetical protein